VQEVFLRLYKNLDSAPRGDLLRPWLLRVTINVALNSLRGQNRSAVRDDEFYKSAVRESDGPTQPVEDYERKQLIAQTRSALDKIREPMRSCLILKQQGLSYREISEILNLNEACVGSYVARGRKELVRVYGKVGSSK